MGEIPKIPKAKFLWMLKRLAKQKKAENEAMKKRMANAKKPRSKKMKMLGGRKR